METKKEDRVCGNCRHYDEAGRMAYRVRHRDIVAMCQHLLLLRECTDKCFAWSAPEDKSVRKGKRV